MFDLFFVIILAFVFIYAKNTRNQLNHFKQDVKKALKKKDFKEALLELLEPSHPISPPMPPTQEILAEQDKTAQTTRNIVKTKSILSSPKKENSMGSLEENFARRASVWLGGIALAIGGVFLVKQSIEAGLLTPEVRVISGVVFGLLLIGAGEFFHKRIDKLPDPRISQALFGSGSIVFFGIVYAASSLYGLIDSLTAFSLMAAIMIGTLFRALTYGMPVALLGLTGAFVTPLLIQSTTPNASGLFIYLTLILFCTLWLMRKQNWTLLFYPLLLFTFGWPLLWVFSYGYTSIISLFMLVSLGGILAIMPQMSFSLKEEKAKPYVMNSVLLGAAGILFMTLHGNNYTLLDWGLIGVLTTGLLTMLALKDEADTYKIIPWSLLIFTSTSLFFSIKTTSDLNTTLLLIVAFGALYHMAGALFMWLTKKPIRYALLLSLSSLGHFALAKFAFYIHLLSSSALLWGGTSIALAALFTFYITKLKSEAWDLKVRNRISKDHTLFILSATATAFVSITAANILDENWWPIAFAAQAFSLALLTKHFPLPKIDKLFVPLFLGTILSAFNTYGEALSNFTVIHVHISWKGSLLHILIPALLFLFANLSLNKKEQTFNTKVMHAGALTIFILFSSNAFSLLFYESKELWANNPLWSYRDVLQNLFLLSLTFGIYSYGKFMKSTTAFFITEALLGITIVKYIAWNIILSNPYLSHIPLGDYSLANGLLSLYLIPGIMLFYITKTMPLEETFIRIIQGLIGIFAFLFVNLSVAHFWRGSIILNASLDFQESLSYSVVWMILAIGILMYGIAKKRMNFRYAGLGLLIAALLKVSLYDTFDLDGLYRAFAYIGLGISLIGVSYLYQRYVVPEKK